MLRGSASTWARAGEASSSSAAANDRGITRLYGKAGWEGIPRKRMTVKLSFGAAVVWPGSGENRTARPTANLCARMTAQREQATGPGAEALNNDPRAGPLRATRTGSHEQPENRSVAPA